MSRTGYRLMVSDILASDGIRYQLVVDYSTRPAASRFDLRRVSNAKEVSCPGATWSMKRSADEYAATVPTTCLGDPVWVRVGLGFSTGPYKLKNERVDDSRTKGRIGERYLSLGPRQHSAG